MSIGQDGDLRRPGFGVDAHPRAAEPLGCGDVDVARPGDHVDRHQLGAVGVHAAVRHQRYRLGSADRPHLVDAEQPGGGQDRRMRQSPKPVGAALGLRRAGHHQRADTGGLRRHDVHHDARRVHRVAAGNVQADPLDRHPPLGHGGTRAQRRRRIRPALIGMHRTGALDHHLQRQPDFAFQTGQRGIQLGAGHPDRRWPDAVQRFAVVQCGLSASIGNRVDDRAHRGKGGLHVHSATGQRRPQPGDGQVATPQVDARHHSHANHCPRAEQPHIGPVQ